MWISTARYLRRLSYHSPGLGALLTGFLGMAMGVPIVSPLLLASSCIANAILCLTFDPPWLAPTPIVEAEAPPLDGLPQALDPPPLVKLPALLRAPLLLTWKALLEEANLGWETEMDEVEAGDSGLASSSISKRG